jgi:hypothetical protein
VVWIATTAVVVHLASFALWVSASILALSVALAMLMRRRWTRMIGADPQVDLYKVLFLPTWGAAALVIVLLVFAATVSGDVKPPPPKGIALLFGFGAALPSVFFSSWFASAAARGGPQPPDSPARQAVRTGLWRTVAATLWPVQVLGLFDTMKGRASVALPLTVACWLAVLVVTAVHVSAWRRPDEPDLQAALKTELRADVLTLVAITLPLVGHVLLFVTNVR